VTDAKHTPEPWPRLDEINPDTRIPHAKQGLAECCGSVLMTPENYLYAKDRVNALRGLDVAKVEALLDAVRAEVKSDERGDDEETHARYTAAGHEAYDALADSIRAGGAPNA